MDRKRQLVQGLLFGAVFGFLLQKGGVTRYDVIIGQLLLEDFTVVKVMLTAVLTGMIGVHAMKQLGWVRLSPKAGSWSQNVIGGLIFGAGFALLGYCPGTIAGAIGNRFLDAMAGGLTGILLGSGLFAALYPRLRDGILKAGYYGDVTLSRLLKVGDWTVIGPLGALLMLTLFLLERAGL
ncbi:MAG TPA: YeeE/YedE thiosulfate transporter family protein [Syntrophales bacterium]|nr:YeeE/YedE family protein [Syntrophobacterales bacterium]HQL91179.1 YeeE/YedE thiosulfate transporter family protein [Syntrophales bacterium]